MKNCQLAEDVIITSTPAALLVMKCINFAHTGFYNRLKTSHQSKKKEGHMTFTRTWNQRSHVLYCVALLVLIIENTYRCVSNSPLENEKVFSILVVYHKTKN